ncbi:MAG: sodium:solute symporter family protein [Bacteroidota bacterium]
MNWFLFWIIIYLVVIAYFAFRHVKAGDIDNYLVNNRNTATLPLVFTTLATFVGGGTSIGLIAMGYESGFAAVGIGIAYVIGFFIVSGYAARIHSRGRKLNLYSFPEFLNKHYTREDDDGFKKVFSALVSGINIFIFFFLLAAQFVGMATLLKLAFNIAYLESAVISCFVVIAYTAIAGLSGVIITDTIQFIVILIMIILVFIPGIIADTATFTQLSELPESFMNGSHYGWIFIIGLPLFLAPSVLVRMDIWQRMLAAKSEKVARRVTIYSGLGMLPFYIIFPLVGMAVYLKAGHALDPKETVWVFLESHAGPFVLAFAVVGLLSALMSSGDSFLNLISISAVRDFSGWRKKKKDRNIRRERREILTTTFIFGTVAMIMALVFPNIVDLMVIGLASIVIFAPITILALSIKNVWRYRKLAIASIGAGFVVNLVFFVAGLLYPEDIEIKASFIPAFIVASLVILLGLIIKPKVYDTGRDQG